MQAIIDDAAIVSSKSGGANDDGRYNAFRSALEYAEQHPIRSYFVLKAIALNNLFGVDIMEEAVEICKLRLFLKLVSELEDVSHVEPLPDLDFNIRCGNSLVGFVSHSELEAAATLRLDFEEMGKQIDSAAVEAAAAFKKFRNVQVDITVSPLVVTESKQALSVKLKDVAYKANAWLAEAHGVGGKGGGAVDRWVARVKPFHWYTEFFSVLDAGGFDVVLGNPPFLEASQVDYPLGGFRASASRTVHGCFVERFTQLRRPGGSIGVVMPMSVVSTQRMTTVQNEIERGSMSLYANFAWRPATLFSNVNRAITLIVARHGVTNSRTFTTSYMRWLSTGRETLLQTMHYFETETRRPSFWVPKLRSKVEVEILEAMFRNGTELERHLGGRINPIYYKSTGGLYWKVFTDFPPRFRINGKKAVSSRQKVLYCREFSEKPAIVAALASNVFWWWYTITSNLRDLNPSDINGFRVPQRALKDERLQRLGEELMKDLADNSVTMTRRQRTTGETEVQSFRIKASKPLLDQVDQLLVDAYGLSVQHAEFISSYDVAWRMGTLSGDEEDNDEE